MPAARAPQATSAGMIARRDMRAGRLRVRRQRRKQQGRRGDVNH